MEIVFNLQVCAQPNYNSNVMVKKLKPFQADTFKEVHITSWIYCKRKENMGYNKFHEQNAVKLSFVNNHECIVQIKLICN